MDAYDDVQQDCVGTPDRALGSDSNEMLSARSTVTALFGCVYTSTERIDMANKLSVLR